MKLLSKGFIFIVALYTILWISSLDSMSISQMAKGVPVIIICLAYLNQKVKEAGYWIGGDDYE